MSASHVNSTNFASEVLGFKGKVLVDFYASWCGPCKIMSPIIDELAKEMKDVKFVKVDVDADGTIAAQYAVQSIPTFILFENGKATKQQLGAVGKQGIINMLKQ